METKPTSFRLAEGVRELIRDCASHLNLKDAQIVEMGAKKIWAEIQAGQVTVPLPERPKPGRKKGK